MAYRAFFLFRIFSFFPDSYHQIFIKTKISGFSCLEIKNVGLTVMTFSLWYTVVAYHWFLCDSFTLVYFAFLFCSFLKIGEKTNGSSTCFQKWVRVRIRTIFHFRGIARHHKWLIKWFIVFCQNLICCSKLKHSWRKLLCRVFVELYRDFQKFAKFHEIF